MVIDTSALLAILWKEPEVTDFLTRIASDPVRLLSSVSKFEAGIVVETRRGVVAGHELSLLLNQLEVEAVSFDPAQADLALHAWRLYGKGRHPAGLNFGDCCAYALAKLRRQPLLFKGADFTGTDVARCL